VRAPPQFSLVVRSRGARRRAQPAGWAPERVFNTFFGYEGSSTKVYARASEFDDCRTCLVAQPIELTTPEGVARLCRAGLEAEVLKESRLAP
jgi:hypothetical protein